MCGYFHHCYECVFLLLCSVVTLLFFPLTDDTMVWVGGGGGVLGGSTPGKCQLLCPTGTQTLVTPELRSQKTNTEAWTSCECDMRREGGGDAAGEVSDPEEVQIAPPPTFLAPDKVENSRYTTAGWFCVSPICDSVLFVRRTQTALPGRQPRLTSSRLTCDPRGHVTALSPTVFTADADGAALPRTVALFTRGCFLKGAGAARPAFPCCFGNRASAPANGRARD